MEGNEIAFLPEYTIAKHNNSRVAKCDEIHGYYICVKKWQHAENLVLLMGLKGRFGIFFEYFTFLNSAEDWAKCIAAAR